MGSRQQPSAKRRTPGGRAPVARASVTAAKHLFTAPVLENRKPEGSRIRRPCNRGANFMTVLSGWGITARPGQNVLPSSFGGPVSQLIMAVPPTSIRAICDVSVECLSGVGLLAAKALEDSRSFPSGVSAGELGTRSLVDASCYGPAFKI